jgi:hypothetical protein
VSIFFSPSTDSIPCRVTPFDGPSTVTPAAGMAFNWLPWKKTKNKPPKIKKPKEKKKKDKKTKRKKGALEDLEGERRLSEERGRQEVERRQHEIDEERRRRSLTFEGSASAATTTTSVRGPPGGVGRTPSVPASVPGSAPVRGPDSDVEFMEAMAPPPYAAAGGPAARQPASASHGNPQPPTLSPDLMSHGTHQTSEGVVVSNYSDGWDGGDGIPAPEYDDYLDSFIPQKARDRPSDPLSKISYYDSDRVTPHPLPHFGVPTGDPADPIAEFPTRRPEPVTRSPPRRRAPLSLPDPADVFAGAGPIGYPTTQPTVTHVYTTGAAPSHFGYVPTGPVNPILLTPAQDHYSRPPDPDVWFQSYALGKTKIPPPPLPQYRHPQPPWPPVSPFYLDGP